MVITCTRKFSWPDGDGGARYYFPGQAIENLDAAAFAVEAGYGEDKGEQPPSAIIPLRSPEDKKASLAKSGGETKADKKAREKAERQAAREAEQKSRGVQADEDEVVEDDQDVDQE